MDDEFVDYVLFFGDKVYFRFNRYMSDGILGEIDLSNTNIIVKCNKDKSVVYHRKIINLPKTKNDINFIWELDEDIRNIPIRFTVGFEGYKNNKPFGVTVKKIYDLDKNEQRIKINSTRRM